MSVLANDRVPPWMRLVDWAFWANVFFFVGSILWTVSALMCWTTEESEACNWVAFAASICFLFNGPLYVVEWWIFRHDYRQVHGTPTRLYGGGLPRSDCGPAFFYFQHVDWYLYSNTSFFVGTLGDLLNSGLSHVGFDDQTALYVDLFTDMLSSHFWTISGAMMVCEWYFQMRAREFHNAPIQYTMVPWRVGSRALPCKRGGDPADRRAKVVVVYKYDWNGIGDWFFWPAAIGYAVGTYVCFFDPLFHFCWFTQMVGGVGFLIDAVFYFPPLIEHNDTIDPETGAPVMRYYPYARRDNEPGDVAQALLAEQQLIDDARQLEKDLRRRSSKLRDEEATSNQALAGATEADDLFIVRELSSEVV